MEQVAMLAEESKGKSSLFNVFRTSHTRGSTRLDQCLNVLSPLCSQNR